ncbi:CPBP family intramembrane glutamic endopeptidase [Pleomorphomonas koreensis]|uniref:CPBP family intramembrane glutamic endopeptidase n=1 Tax=Pleomorphomonas koreensis TaxID=257440 RepID=UPI0009FD60DF|nr:CPBP family intramembrane glutamic endopeptidase [Pleomorphomonas koreensis]
MLQWIEHRRLPFVAGNPAISGRGCVLIIASILLGFTILSSPQAKSLSGGLTIIPALLFTALPLSALAYVSEGRANALFRHYDIKALGLSLLFALCTITASFLAGWIASFDTAMKQNPVNDLVAAMRLSELPVFLIRTFVQLIGEELATILPLLAATWLFMSRLHASYASSIWAGTLVSTLWFSAMHLPTYDWNIVQCFLVIGISRLILTASYLYTKNIWVSAGAHIINDWTFFALGYAGSHVSVASSQIFI